MKVLPLIMVAGMIAVSVRCGDGDGGTGEGVPPCDTTPWLELEDMQGTTSRWQIDRAVTLSISNGECDSEATLDDAWRNAISALVELTDLASGAPMPYTMAQDSMTGNVRLITATPFAADAAYRITVRPGAGQTAKKDLKMRSFYGGVPLTGSPECAYLYTMSKPVIARIDLSPTEFGDLHVYFTASELLRRDGLTGAAKPQLLVDGVDQTVCQGPPSCCITGTTADGGMNPDTPCEVGGSSFEYNGETIEGDYGFYFVVPLTVRDSFATFKLRLPATLAGLGATVADAITGIPYATLDGDSVVYTFTRAQFKETEGSGLYWTPPCE